MSLTPGFYHFKVSSPLTRGRLGGGPTPLLLDTTAKGSSYSHTRSFLVWMHVHYVHRRSIAVSSSNIYHFPLLLGDLRTWAFCGMTQWPSAACAVLCIGHFGRCHWFMARRTGVRAVPTCLRGEVRCSIGDGSSPLLAQGLGIVARAFRQAPIYLSISPPAWRFAYLGVCSMTQCPSGVCTVLCSGTRRALSLVIPAAHRRTSGAYLLRGEVRCSIGFGSSRLLAQGLGIVA